MKSKHSIGPGLAVALVAAVAGLSTGAAGPVAAAGGNPFICKDLEAKRQRLPEEPLLRDLNFMLFEAVKSGCADLIEDLLASGASVGARDRFANTALVLAAAAGQNEAIRILLDGGAKIDHQNLVGSSALLRAAMDNRRRTAVLLLERGADPNLANAKKLTALHAAAYNGNRRMIDALLAGGADPDVIDTTGKSPVIYAAARGYVEIVDRLLAAGIDPSRRYGNNLTLLMWAAGHSNDTPEKDGLATVDRILAAGAELDAVDNRGWTALMVAAERGHALVAERLLARGADPAIADGKGRRAADLTTDAALRDRLSVAR